MASAVTSAPASGESATAPLSNGIAGSRKIRTAHTKFLHHSLDISEIAPGLAVMAQPRPGHSSVMKAFLLHRYGRTSSIIRVFDLEPSWSTMRSWTRDSSSASLGGGGIGGSPKQKCTIEYFDRFAVSNKSPPALEMLRQFCQVACRPVVGLVRNTRAHGLRSGSVSSANSIGHTGQASHEHAPEGVTVVIMCRDGVTLCCTLACSLLMTFYQLSLRKALEVFSSKRLRSGTFRPSPNTIRCLRFFAHLGVGPSTSLAVTPAVSTNLEKETQTGARISATSRSTAATSATVELRAAPKFLSAISISPVPQVSSGPFGGEAKFNPSFTVRCNYCVSGSSISEVNVSGDGSVRSAPATPSASDGRRRAGRLWKGQGQSGENATTTNDDGAGEHAAEIGFDSATSCIIETKSKVTGVTQREFATTEKAVHLRLRNKIPLVNDFSITFKHKAGAALSKDKLWRVWGHTSFLQGNLLRLNRKDIDILGAQKIFPPDFSVELSFIDATETHLREFVQFGFGANTKNTHVGKSDSGSSTGSAQSYPHLSSGASSPGDAVAERGRKRDQQLRVQLLGAAKSPTGHALEMLHTVVRAALKNRQGEHKQKWFKTMLAKVEKLKQYVEFGPNLTYLHMCLAFTPESKRIDGRLWEPPEAASKPATPVRESPVLTASIEGHTEATEVDGHTRPRTLSNGVPGRELSGDDVQQILLSVELELSSLAKRVLRGPASPDTPTTATTATW